MKDLIEIKKSNGGKDIVSARELYKFLELEERFSKWIDRMLSYGFEDQVDYTLYQMVHPQNQQLIKDYGLTLDMAKELSMIQRTEKGKQARRYFIECEKNLKEVSLPSTFSEALQLAANQAKKIEEQNIQIEESKLKIEFFDTVTQSKDWLDMGEVSKILNIKNLGRNNLYKKLRELKLINGDNQPYQQYVSSGCFKIVEVPKPLKNGGVKICLKLVISQKGIDYIIKKLK